MDLSVEAECFGAEIKVTDNEVPTVVGQLIKDEDDAQALKVPAVGSGRSQLYIDAIKKLKQKLKISLFWEVVLVRLVWLVV